MKQISERTVATGDILIYGKYRIRIWGTRGKFPVHLHLGIYIEVPFQKRAECKSILASENFEKKSETIHIKLHNLLKVCYNAEYQSVLGIFLQGDLYGNTVMEKYFYALTSLLSEKLTVKSSSI